MKKYLTEFVGTFFLVFVIGLTTNDPQLWAGGGTPFAPIAIGTILMVMVYMGGPVSGAHYNPAVTLALWMRKKMEPKDAAPYMLSQILGAIFASLTYYFIFKLSMGGPKPLPGFTYDLKPMILEAIFTFALVAVVLSVAASKKSAGNSYYGLAIGFTVMTAAFAAGKVSGGAFNPAVGVGTLLVDMFIEGNDISHVWIYIVGPCLGGIVAAMFYKATNADE